METSKVLIRALAMAVATKKAAASKCFLPEKLVMVDCEMDGVVAGRDKLLQAAFLKLAYNKSKKCYEEISEPLVLYFPHDGKPKNDFQKKYLTEIFQKCNKCTTPIDANKATLHDWLGNYAGEATPVGDCVPTDIAFLLASGLIDPCDFGEDGEPIKGTFHYEYFDLNSVKAIAREACGEKFEVEGLDNEGIHDALVDCKNQLLELNEYLKRML